MPRASTSTVVAAQNRPVSVRQVARISDKAISKKKAFVPKKGYSKFEYNQTQGYRQLPAKMGGAGQYKTKYLDAVEDGRLGPPIGLNKFAPKVLTAVKRGFGIGYGRSRLPKKSPHPNLNAGRKLAVRGIHDVISGRALESAGAFQIAGAGAKSEKSLQIYKGSANVMDTTYKAHQKYRNEAGAGDWITKYPHFEWNKKVRAPKVVRVKVVRVRPPRKEKVVRERVVRVKKPAVPKQKSQWRIDKDNKKQEGDLEKQRKQQVFAQLRKDAQQKKDNKREAINGRIAAAAQRKIAKDDRQVTRENAIADRNDRRQEEARARDKKNEERQDAAREKRWAKEARAGHLRARKEKKAEKKARRAENAENVKDQRERMNAGEFGDGTNLPAFDAK